MGRWNILDVVFGLVDLWVLGFYRRVVEIVFEFVDGRGFEIVFVLFNGSVLVIVLVLGLDKKVLDL